MGFRASLLEVPAQAVELGQYGLDQDLDLDRTIVVGAVRELGERRDKGGAGTDRTQRENEGLEPFGEDVVRDVGLERPAETVAELPLRLRYGRCRTGREHGGVEARPRPRVARPHGTRRARERFEEELLGVLSNARNWSESSAASSRLRSAIGPRNHAR